MRASHVVVLAFSLLVGAAACGDGQAAPISGGLAPSGGVGGGGSTQDPFCRDYCVSIVANGTDCAHYNDGRHCEDVCGFYRAGGCSDMYTTFVECNKNDAQLSCFLAASGKWGINIVACNSEYEAFNTCIDERDAGVCPY